MDNLKELYVDQLQDLYSANKQAEKCISELANAASDSQLKNILQEAVKNTGGRNERLEKAIKGHGAKPDGEFCKGTEGLVKEARKHAIEADISDDSVRDAQIIAQFQRLSHYGIAGYGTCRAFARQLGLNEEASKLEECLDTLYKGDDIMTSLAEGEVNERAAA